MGVGVVGVWIGGDGGGVGGIVGVGSGSNSQLRISSAYEVRYQWDGVVGVWIVGDGSGRMGVVRVR